MNGDSSGIKGGLKFESRVLARPRNGETVAEKERIVVSNADSALLLIVVATSYRSFKDISGNPRAITTAQLIRAGRKSLASLRTMHVREYQRLFHRVKLDLGQHRMVIPPN